MKNYSVADKNDFLSLFTDKVVMKHVDSGPIEFSKAENFWKKVITKKTAPRKEVRAVFEKASGKYLGNASIIESPYQKGELEIGFVLRRESWGNGFGTEIAKTLIEYCFKVLDVKAVYATVDDDNYASINVLKKAGMRFLRYEFDKAGRFSVYSIETVIVGLRSVDESNS